MLLHHFCPNLALLSSKRKDMQLNQITGFPRQLWGETSPRVRLFASNNGKQRDSANSDSGVTALLSTSSNPGVIHVWPFFFRVPFKRLLCEEGACRFCAKWLVWDRADHISSEGDRSLAPNPYVRVWSGRAFGSSANSASRGVGDRPLSSGALTHGPSGQRQRQCQYRTLVLPSRAAFNRGLGAAFVVVITTASRGASMQR